MTKKCTCGEDIKSKNGSFCSRTCYWKSLLGRKLSENHKRKIGKALKGGNSGSFKKGEHRSQGTEFKKGQVAWNKGKSHLKGELHPMFGKKVSEKTKEKIRKKRKTQVMSKEHIAKLVQRKEKHWNWKGGISGLNNEIRHSEEYTEWRNAVWRRDNWTCQKCTYKGKNIIAHHIKYFSTHPELRFEVSNGQTLCRKCHLEVHGGVSVIRWKNEKVQ